MALNANNYYWKIIKGRRLGPMRERNGGQALLGNLNLIIFKFNTAGPNMSHFINGQ